MSAKGTCLQTYIPVRKEPRSGSEMVTSLVFGESYTVYESENDFLKIITEFDQYPGWISAGSHSEYRDYKTVVDHIFIEASSEHQIMFIPCGGLIPETGNIEIDGKIFTPERKLKTSHHLPLSLRINKLASSFLNMPYLWGGRTFMGLDCSGFIQMVFRANGYNLPRDTSEQIKSGVAIDVHDAKPCDLVFFSKPGSDKVVHVGLMLEKGNIIHSSNKVRIDTLQPEGIFIDHKHVYQILAVRRII